MADSIRTASKQWKVYCRWRTALERLLSVIENYDRGSRDNSDMELWRESIGTEAADRIRDFACTRGTRHHALIEQYLDFAGSLDWTGYLDDDGLQPPASVVGESIDDAELDALFTEIDQSGEPLSWRAYARAILARWGHQPTPPAEGEVAELVAALCADAECAEVEHYDLCNMTADQMRRAAELLQQQEAELQECRKVAAAFENFNQQRNAND